MGAIVVVYQPDMLHLRQLVQRLAGLVGDIVLVNNGVGALAASDFTPAFQEHASTATLGILNLGSNFGVAAALNRGVSYLETRRCTLAWSFDQDSLPAADALAQLLSAWEDTSVAALAPAMRIDVDAAGLAGGVGFRAVVADRLPLVGPLPHPDAPWSGTDRVAVREGLYAIGAFASRGLVWSALAGEVLASRIDGEPLPIETDLAAAIDPARFVRRARRRGAG